MKGMIQKIRFYVQEETSENKLKEILKRKRDENGKKGKEFWPFGQRKISTVETGVFRCVRARLFSGKYLFSSVLLCLSESISCDLIDHLKDPIDPPPKSSLNLLLISTFSLRFLLFLSFVKHHKVNSDYLNIHL